MVHFIGWFELAKLTMAVYLGLDCGGTSTRAVALDERGEVLFEGKSGPANWASTERDQLREHIVEALTGAPKADTVCGCFAGLLTPEDKASVEAMLKEVSGADKALGLPDFHAALRASGPDATACVISGTGSLVFSRTNGDVVKSGGGGPLLGDVGSAFAISREALRVALFGSPVVAAVSDRFRVAMQELFGTSDPSEVPARVYAEPSPARTVAKLAPIVARDAEAGEAYARIVVEDQMKQLAYILYGHLYTHHATTKPWRVFLSGGLWKISPIFLTRLEESMGLMAGAKDIQFSELPVAPVMGAAWLAMEHKG